MASSMVDSAFFRDLFGTDEMRAVFSDEGLLQAWLDTEAALARAEADLGLIPPAAAEEIVRKAHVRFIDKERFKTLVDEMVHPIMPLVKVLQEACAGDAGQYIHWGATTQDIMDTGAVLQLKQAHALILAELDRVAGTCAGLAATHRDTIMPGRTHGQHALPITFGYKVAIWLAELERHRDRLRECAPRVLVGQFAGAAGTLASVAAHGLEIQRRMMDILGLGVPVISWHVARDGFAEFTAILGMITATLGKIANEIISLQKTEVMELEEPFAMGKVGSSTMPHKRNPMLCEAVVALAKLVRAHVATAVDCMVQEHERDMGPWQAEWSYLPEVCIMTHGALRLTGRILAGLRVYPENMARNLGILQGLIVSEAVMMRLAPHLGRQRAHDVVYRASMRAFEQRRPLAETLAEDPEVVAHVPPAELAAALDPHQYTGLAGVFVDRVLSGRNGRCNGTRPAAVG